MKTIQDSIIYGIVRNLIRVVAYHTCISNRRPSREQNMLALGTLVFCAAIIGAILGTLTSIDYVYGHFCNNY